MTIRHFKTGREIWNQPVCVDDFGNQVFICQYTRQYVSTADYIILGACIPQAVGSYVCAPGAEPAFKESKRAFDAWDANCNTCAAFERLPHEKDKVGLVRGTCGTNQMRAEYPMVYRRQGREYWIHPDDQMGLPCWTARLRKGEVFHPKFLTRRRANPPPNPTEGFFERSFHSYHPIDFTERFVEWVNESLYKGERGSVTEVIRTIRKHIAHSYRFITNDMCHEFAGREDEWEVLGFKGYNIDRGDDEDTLKVVLRFHIKERFTEQVDALLKPLGFTRAK